MGWQGRHGSVAWLPASRAVGRAYRSNGRSPVWAAALGRVRIVARLFTMEPVQPDHDRPRSPEVADGSDVWDLWFWSPLAQVGGYARLELRDDVSWYWAALCGPQRQLVSVVEPDAPLPRSPGLELRASGLWAEVVIQTALDHVTTGLEAFGVGLDDPFDAYGKAWGDQVPLGYDLEWETSGTPGAVPGGFHVPCEVHGEILVGREVLDLQGWGHRIRRWGHPDWCGDARWVMAGRLGDGCQIWAEGPEADGAGTGAVAGAIAPAVVSLDADQGGSCRGARLRIGDMYLALEPLAWAPVAGERGARIGRALVRLTTGDGRVGSGWLELVRPS